MRSLRTRFFLISWPLVLAAIVAVALGVDRWTVVELDRIESGPTATRNSTRDSTLANSISSIWSTLASAAATRDPAIRARSSAALARLRSAADSGMQLVVVDSVGTVVAVSDSSVSVLSSPTKPGDVVQFRRLVVRGGQESEERFAFPGMLVRDSTRRLIGALYVLPAPAIVQAPRVSRRTNLRRRIWSVALAASIAAAAASLLLASPVVRRLRTLADAAARIEKGALDVHVDESGGDEIAALGQSFNAMAASLTESKRHQRNLISDVAHELRTPLTNVLGLVEAMQDGLRPADVSTLATLHNEVGVLTTLVHELQELSLAESGQLVMEIASVDACAVVREVVAAFDASSSQCELVADIPEAPVMVRADATRLGQVLRNLLRNALTHTPHDGCVTVVVERRGQMVAIVVVDTGRGIPPEHLTLIFERFHRVDASRERSSGGMGLGLAVVRQLVTAMNGVVWVESEIGRGSRFGVELPGVHERAE